MGYRFCFLPILPGTAQGLTQGFPVRSHALVQLLLAASIAAEVVGSLYALAIWLMSLSVRHLESRLAYPVWARVGTTLPPWWACCSSASPYVVRGWSVLFTP